MAEEKKETPQQPASTGKKEGQLSYEQYQALQAQQAKKVKKEMPTGVKILLYSPIILIAVFGIIYIPYMIFSGFEPETEENEKTEYSQRR